jgi:hypothetical protein
MKKHYSFDASCERLALSFLEDSTRPNGKTADDYVRDVNDLAQEVQNLVEAFLSDRGYA